MNTNTVAALSEMQVACLRLVADLKKTEQIAGELGIAPSTVNTHIERAIARLGVPNRREAARLVVAHDAAQRSGHDARPETDHHAASAAPLTSHPAIALDHETAVSPVATMALLLPPRSLS